MFDTKNNLKMARALSPAAITSNTTTNGTVVDRLDYQSLTLALVSSTITDGTFTPVLKESDTGAFGGEENDVADADLLGTEAAAVFVAADDNTLKTLGYIGQKRYVRLSIVTTGVTSGGTIGAVAVLGDPHVAPVV